jgi:H+-translocating NAD(P) transhydrogenase subunit beta
MDIDWTFIEPIVYLAWLGGAVAFVLGLIQMNSPATARNGNLLSAGGMALAILATAFLLFVKPSVAGTDAGEVASGFNAVGWLVILAGIALGGGFGLYTARSVKMTAMPQLVSLFNAVGGGAAALIAIDEYLKFAGASVVPGLTQNVATVLDVVIGSITFTGSLVASGKLMGLKITPSRPVRIPGGQLVTLALALITIAGALFLWSGNVSLPVLGVILLAALVFGVTMTLPIGGADMPVVISLLNSFTGMAVAMAGFVLGNPVLIIGGALVGASGAILTKLMADAMNRSVINIMIGGFGGGEGTVGAVSGAGGSVRELGMDDAAIQLAYASSVIVVPGYGLAVAQAQHAVRELAEILEARGVDVKYAIHPVAGRMPGHMNVLLAEANVPYPQLKEMEDINPEFDRCDVALVIGANDVTNPAARKPGSPVSGMPILDVDHAKNIIVMKRSMGRGYAGIDNELYVNPKTGMLFADAKQGLADLISAVKSL